MEWTAETDAMVLALDAEGLTRRAIAERLGVSRNAICGKLHRLRTLRTSGGKTTMPDEPADDPPSEALPGPTLGKWWEPPRPREPDVADESALEALALALVESVPALPVRLPELPPVVVVAKSPEPPIDDEEAELRYLMQKYKFVLHLTTNRNRLLNSLRGFERDRELIAEYAWKLHERVSVAKGPWEIFWCTGGDIKWERPDPAVGWIDMIKGGHIRVSFDAPSPYQAGAWFKPSEFHHLERV